MGLIGFLYPLSEFVAWYFFIDRYSFWDAFLLCVTTGFVGLYIVAIHGRALLQDMQGQGFQAPQAGAFHRLLIIFGGLLLFVPGLVAKVGGTLLILPGSRHLLLWLLKGLMAEKLMRKGFEFVFTRGQSGFGGFSAGFGRAGGFDFNASSRSEREARVVREDGVLDVTPTSIEHKNLTDD